MADEDAPPPPTLEAMFVAFAKFGQPVEIDGSQILLSQLDMWMKQSKVKSKNFTLTDTGTIFSRYKKSRIDFDTFTEYLEICCNTKNLNVDEVREKMTTCGLPGSQKVD